jgi:hypothetical protein
VDGDEHRRTLTRPRKAQRTILIHPAQKGFRTLLDLHNTGRPRQTGSNEGPDQMP